MFATPDLLALAERVRPTAASRTRLLPVAGPLVALLPDGGLRRGTAVRCSSLGLALALAAEASAAGSWCGTVGVEGLGALAAAGYGVDLGRLVVVRAAPGEWAVAVATLLDGVDLVVVEPPGHPRPAAVRTLAARARDRGAVLLVVGSQWPAPVEVALEMHPGRWQGLGRGTGRLEARRVTVTASGRGRGAPTRRGLWLPTAEGRGASRDRGWRGRAGATRFTVPHRALGGNLAEALAQVRWALGLRTAPGLIPSALARGPRALRRVGGAAPRQAPASSTICTFTFCLVGAGTRIL